MNQLLEKKAGNHIQISKPIRTEPLPREFPGVHGMDEQEVEAAIRVIRSKSLYRYYSLTPQAEVNAFESEFSAFLGVKHSLAVTSGTGGLITALAALGVGPGQEVIIPAYMWIAVAAAVVNVGAIPVLADIDDSFCIDPESVRERVTPRTTAVIAVHMNGGHADISRLLDVTLSHKLFLIEDCAQCVGGTIGGRSVGTFGDIGVFSFQTNKNMTCGEAGCVVTNDEGLYQRAVAAHDAGYTRTAEGLFSCDDTEVTTWGRGYRLDELRAAILRVQLRKLPQVISRMRSSKYHILESLKAFPQVRPRKIIDPNGDTGGFLITTYPDEATARETCRSMRANGIATCSPDTSNVVLADYGLHIYYNIGSLVRKRGTDDRGTPWTLEENRGSKVYYEKGTNPVADDLFGRSILFTIPSCLSRQDEDDIIQGFHQALANPSATG